MEIQNGKTRNTALEKALKKHEDAEPERRRLEENHRKQVREIESNHK